MATRKSIQTRKRTARNRSGGNRTTKERASKRRTRSRRPQHPSVNHGLADRTIKKAKRTIDIPVSWYWSRWGHVIKYKGKRWEYAGLFRNQSEIHENIERRKENIRHDPTGWRYEYMVFKTPAKYHIAPWAMYYRLYRLNPDTKRWTVHAPWASASHHVR